VDGEHRLFDGDSREEAFDLRRKIRTRGPEQNGAAHALDLRSDTEDSERLPCVRGDLGCAGLRVVVDRAKVVGERRASRTTLLEGFGLHFAGEAQVHHVSAHERDEHIGHARGDIARAPTAPHAWQRQQRREVA